MDPSTEAADLALATYRARQSVEGRFLSYCRGRSRSSWFRLVVTAACFPLVAMTDERLAAIVLLAILAGELLDAFVLRRLGAQPVSAERLPPARALATLTAGVQALAVVAGGMLLHAHGGADARIFVGAVFLAGVLDAARAFGVHKGASVIRIVAYMLGLSIMIAQSLLNIAVEGPAAIYNTTAVAMIVCVMWSYTRNVQRQRERRNAMQLATLEGARDLAHVNATLQASRQRTRQLAAVAERANDSVIITDVDGVIKWVNRAFTQVTGYEFEEAVGRNVNFLNGPDADAAAISELNAARVEGRRARVEIVSRHKEDRPVWIEVNMAPVLDETGAVERFVNIERDVSEARRREQALAKARLTAESAVRARHAFLATMSHEIRTPMNGVIGTADLLMQTSLSESQRALVRTISSSGEALLAIVDDILDFSKLDAGRLEVLAEPFSLERCLRHALDLVRPLADAKGLDLRLVLPPGLPAGLVGDEGRIRQVMLNLLSNAIKFTEQGSVGAEVGVRLEGGRCRILVSVRDTGVGIEPARLGRVFDSFTQADASVAGRFGGTGLGLAISRKLVRAMGGEISAASRPGEGSVFFVSLALPVAEHLPVAEERPCGSPPPRLDGVRILVAEDNRTNRLLLEKMLSSLGAIPIFAVNGREAVDLQELHSPDIVLMDVHMPVLDGLSASRAIRANAARAGCRPVPIIAVTANAFPEERDLCLEAGMEEVITKPFRLEDLRAALVPHCFPKDGVAPASLSCKSARQGATPPGG